MNKIPINVLLFEDNPGDARLFKEFLNENDLAKVNLEQVDRLNTGLERLAQGKPDVILVDLGLPDSQGLETFRKIHNHAQEVPIVVLTGLNDAELAIEAVRLGAQDYLVKGEVSSGLLGRAIRYAMERKQAEKTLAASEMELRALFASMKDVVIVYDIDGQYIKIAPTNPGNLLLPPEEMLGRNVHDVLPKEQADQIVAKVRESIQSAKVINSEYFLKVAGKDIWFEASISPLVDDTAIWVAHDITERRRAEQALVKSEIKFRWLYEYAPVAYHILTPDGIITDVNHRWCELLGFRREEALGKAIFDFMVEEERELAKASFEKKKQDKETYFESGERNYRTKEGAVKTVKTYDFFALDEGQNITSVQTTIEDITEHKQAEKRIQRQLEHLTALSGIDRVISANFDLKLSLSEILNHVTKELGVDAADILILNSGLQMLEYGAERGFRTKAIRKAQVRLGESYAGRVALEKQLVQIPHLEDEPDNILLKTHLAGEDFVCYFGVPLIIKGVVKGVLEIFHRAALAPDAEWFDFLNTLAGQAAIAVEIATLFETLQLSNSELFLAYGATIEGWSYALDLRDKETEGHTQRVTEMTLKLAHAFDISEADLVQVRWGALLHDIGKMGVPDNILLKPGPLTDEEWVVMKKHPTFAYEMLSPIHYLQAALDIPYCHHEKWDGTGYPRGLKGEQIPLAARIFAVVDVWDALVSDRPYRLAWSEEKARQHIRAEAGTHFDPQVVKTFFLENE
jgi:PAS domain S-box-containing protein/putative nucleotidyltransferase with HDIG domain